MKIGLFFGSFNPIHVGHLIIAQHMLQKDLDRVWLVVSPHNPLKEKKSLLPTHHRIYMANLAVEDNAAIQVSDIETKLDQPSYTVNTLAHLREKYPSYEFVLLMGEDNLATFHKWKNPEEILKHHEIYVYARTNESFVNRTGYFAHSRIKLEPTPLLDVSSTFIREQIKAGKDVRYLLTEPVYKYVNEMNFYK